jgi:hypothetical protein
MNSSDVRPFRFGVQAYHAPDREGCSSWPVGQSHLDTMSLPSATTSRMQPTNSSQSFRR